MLHASFEQRQKARNKAAEMFAQGISNAEIGRTLGVSRPTVSGWYQIWEKLGQAGLSIGTPGTKPRITDEDWQRIEHALLEGPQAQGYDTDLWTLARIAEVIEKITGVAYNPNYVRELLVKHGWSCQKPESRAKERDEQAISDWKEHRWVQIKRGHKKAAQH